MLTNACADFTWALILAVTRRLGEGERELRAGRWKGWALDHLLGMELRGKQLGLVGMGRIARAVADKAPAFGMSVAYTDQVVTDVPGATAMPLDRLLATSDVVSLHVNLTPQTTHLIDQKALAKMRRSAYLINTSRGPVVDEAALAWALRERLIAGAALDVYEKEPVVHPDLLGLENALLIPHLASATTETRTAMADLAVSNVLAVLDGRPAAHAGAMTARGRGWRPSAAPRPPRPRRGRPDPALVERVLRDAGPGHRRHGAAGDREDLRVAAGRPVPGAHRDAAVGAHAGRDDAGGVDAAVRARPHAAGDGRAAARRRSSG